MRPFQKGQTARLRFTVDDALLAKFAALSGDVNPLHVDAEAARAYGYPRHIAHGALLTAFVSRLIGTQLPGPGALCLEQRVQWPLPVFPGDQIELTGTVAVVSEAAGVLIVRFEALNQDGKRVMAGQTTVKVLEA